MLIHHYIEHYARSYPGLPCVTTEGVTLSYADVDLSSNQLAHSLQRLGLAKGDRIALIGENSLNHLVALIAASKIGVVVVSLNYRLAPPELDFIIRDSDAKVLIAIGDMQPLYSDLRSIIPESIHVISTQHAGELGWENMLAKGESTKVIAELDQHDPYLQLYTSGTTGNPKGVVLSHANLLAEQRISEASMADRSSPGSVSILCAPLFHIAGAASMILNVIAGVHSVLHTTFDPQKIVDDIEEYPDIKIFMVPAMIMAVLQIPGIEKRDFSKLNMIAYGAAPITETLLQRAIEVFQCKFIQTYGMTETTGTVVSLLHVDHQKALQGKPEILRACGRAAVGVQLRIMDTKGNEVPVGEVGEIWVKSDTNMLAYYNLPEQTAATVTDGWVHTGDAAYLDEEGYVYLKDRIKDMVVSGGENIYPVEVENALSKHDAIVDVAVIGVPNEQFGEALLAIAVLKPGASLSVEEMIEYCRDQIAGYKIPRQLKLIDELPRNASGKVLKKVLREPYWKDSHRRVG